MGYLIIAAQFFLSLSILIILHEMGHFFPARWFKTRVEKFFLFFDVKGKLWSKKIGETEYGIGWLPLGGYVKISGMVDESMDTDQLATEPQPWEFRSKPTWQRLIIILGGVTVNFILGFFIYAMLLWQNGESYVPAADIPYGIVTSDFGKELGLQDGDYVLKVGDKPYERLGDRDIAIGISVDGAESITVKRNGNIIEIPVDQKKTSEYAKRMSKEDILDVRLPWVIKDIVKNKPADKAGFEAGDKIVAINGVSTPWRTDVRRELGNSKEKNIPVIVERNGGTTSLNVTPSDNGTIGIQAEDTDYFMTLGKVSYGFIESFPAGVRKGWSFLSLQIKAFGQMFKGKINASDSLGGFGTIAKLFPPVWDWSAFWNTTAMLSLILGFFNVLPIPALDGGHAMFIIYEMITRRKPSDQIVQYATIAGMAVLLSLFLYANGLDILRAING